MHALVYAIVLVALSTWRYGIRFRAEHLRQKVLTWPRVPARLVEPKVMLKQSFGDTILLTGGYAFYASGREYLGYELCNERYAMNEQEQITAQQKLQSMANKLMVTYDPKNPERSFLFIAPTTLEWWTFPVYLFFGVALPWVLFYFGWQVYTSAF